MENSPREILNAINDRGITRLAVPDRPVDAAEFEWKEPAQAFDRIVSAWAYSPSGRTSDADIEISSASRRAESNTKMSLDPKQSFMERQLASEAVGTVVVPENEFMAPFESRADEVSLATRESIRDARMALDDERGRTETYRRISASDALGMLHTGDAPPFGAFVSHDDLSFD